MKDKFLKSSIDIIRKNKKYTDEEIEIITYGLEGLYLTFTKMVIIFGIAIYLGIIKDLLCLLVAYNIIRSQAFGIHASKSVYCLITSLIMFIGGTYLSIYLIIPLWLKIAISLLCCILLLIYAPADTHKRPIVNTKKRKRFKCLSTLFGFVYIVLIVVFKESIISNYLLIGMIEATIMILPITYKIFKMPYNNYKSYKFGV